MRNGKKGVVIPFLGNSRNEAVKANMNSTIASDIGSFSGSAAPVKVNIDNAIVHDGDIENKNKKEIKISDELFLNVSNDLTAPINVILGAAQLMELHLKSNSDEIYDEKINKSINSIKQNGLRMTKLINNILDLLKIEAGQFVLNSSNFNIVDIVENVVQNASCIIKESQLSIIFDTDVEEKIVLCDAEKIERVVLNLISNAVMFSNPGGNIYVDVASKENAAEITVSYDDNLYLDSLLDFSGRDKLNSINANGNNIEFCLSKSIIELHGGRLIPINNLNCGRAFTIELPCQNTDSIYSLYNKGSIMNYENLITMINIEFSDINNTGWN